jgi:hypothetical protein
MTPLMPPLRMSDLCIPRALDRHLVSTVHAAATTGDFALGAFDAVVEQITLALRDQGASRAEVEAALRDAFAGLAFPYHRTPVAVRYADLEERAVNLATRETTPRR